VALKRAFRLRKNGDFQRVRQQGRHVTSRLLILAWAPNGTAQLRVGFVVSKRITKLAAERNYIKRLLGEATHPLLEKLPPGLDIVITARPQMRGITLPTLKLDIITLLHRARLLDTIPEKAVPYMSPERS
jgi:ribonuclease P protein component